MIDAFKLGAAVKRLRKARRVTQEDLAATLSVSANYLSQLENGKRGISIPRLNQLAMALNVPASFITFMAEPSTGNRLADRSMEQIQRLIEAAVKVDSEPSSRQSARSDRQKAAVEG